MFDYLTLIFILVLVLGFVIGFARGAFRMLGSLIVFGVAIAVAILVSKPLAAAVQNWGIVGNMNQGLFGFIAGKINISFGAVQLTGETQITQAELAAANEAGKVYYADPNFDIFHTAYAAIHLPSFFYNLVDGLINDAIAAYGTNSFALAQPLADIMTHAICYVACFVVLFLLTVIIGAIILFIIRLALKALPDHKTLISRFVGGVVGLGLAVGTVWVLCLLINIVLLMDNGFAMHLRDVLRYDDPNAWTFAKWLVQTDFGYNAIIAFFIK